jgi:pyruvate/2-oxoglutarate dehydrogenase complex dihydrolipoamide acyltransferase (E2) component
MLKPVAKRFCLMNDRALWSQINLSGVGLLCGITNLSRSLIWSGVLSGVAVICCSSMTTNTAMATENSATTIVRVRTTAIEVVAPRTGELVELLVEDDAQVEANAPIARLVHPNVEREASDQQQLVKIAEEELQAARIAVRAKMAAIRGQWFEVALAQTKVRVQISSLRSAVVALRKEQLKAAAAQEDFDRVTKLAAATSVIPLKDIEDMKESLDLAKEQVLEAREQVIQIRAQLGLDLDNETDEVPEDLDQTATDVQIQLSECAESLMAIGFPFQIQDLRPDEARKKFFGYAEGKSLDQILDLLVDQSPDVRLANANLAKVTAEYVRLKNLAHETVLTAPGAGIFQHRLSRPGSR